MTDYSDKGVGAMSNGSLNKGSLAKIKIPVPPLSVQQDIVEKCEKIDALIADLEQSIEQNKELAKMVLDKSIQNCSEYNSESDSESDIIIDDTESDEESEIFTIETLKKKNCKELRTIAKERKISGRSKMKKDELIEKILSK